MKIFKPSIFLALLISSTSLWAGNMDSGRVTGVYCMSGKALNPSNPVSLEDHCLIYLSKPLTDAAACAGENRTYVTIPVNTELAKAQLSLAMMAQAARKTVSVGSLGVCKHRVGFEALDYIRELD